MTETYQDTIARDYTRGSETERLRLERIEPYAVGDLYEHGKIWAPWPREEAESIRRTAQAILWDPNHVAGHHSDKSPMAVQSCGTCALNNIRKTPPNHSGWHRIYVQAGATIPDDWREDFANILDDENQSYANALGRDIVTFGLRDPRGIVRAPRRY